MTAGSCCRRPALAADRDEPLRAAAQRMEREHVGSLVVTDAGRPLGLLTDRAVALGVLADGLDAGQPVADALDAAPLVAVREDASLREACAAMAREGLRRLPVLDGGGDAVGMLTSDDLVRLAAEDLTALADVAAEQSPRHGRAAAPDPGGVRTARRYAGPALAVREEASVGDVALRLREHGSGCAVVLAGDGAPCGLVTDRDLAVRVVAAGRAATTPVAAVMSAPLASVKPDEGLRAVARRMSAEGLRRLAVVDEGRLVGLVTWDDLLAALAAELHELGQAALGAHARVRPR